MAAVLDGRDAVVMSNEWSSSVGNVESTGARSTTSGRRASTSRPGSGRRAGRCPGTRSTTSPACGPTASCSSRTASPRSALPPHLPELQPGLPHRPRAAARPLVRAVRQVLLHRPDPRAVRAGRGARRRLPWPRAARRPRPAPSVRGAGRHVRRPQAVECVGDVNGVPRGGLPGHRRTDRGSPVLRALVEQLGDRLPPDDAVDALMHPRRPLRAGCVRDRRSPGLTCRAGRSACGGWVSRGRPPSGGWPSWA